MGQTLKPDDVQVSPNPEFGPEDSGGRSFCAGWHHYCQLMIIPHPGGHRADPLQTHLTLQVVLLCQPVFVVYNFQNTSPRTSITL